MTRKMLAVAAALAFFALPAFAADTMQASATSVNGPVQVNTGNQFQNLQEGQALKSGDRVMAMGTGTATIHFDDGCDLKVEPGTMVTVPDKSPCAGGMVTRQTVNPGNGAAVGSSGNYSGVDWRGFWTVAGVVIVGDAILFSEDDNNTSSP